MGWRSGMSETPLTNQTKVDHGLSGPQTAFPFGHKLSHPMVVSKLIINSINQLVLKPGRLSVGVLKFIEFSLFF